MLTVDEFTDQYAPSEHRGEFLYHVTQESVVPSIRTHGLDPRKSHTRTCPAELLLKLVSDRAEAGETPELSGDNTLPFDRRRSAFAWPSLPMESVFEGGAIIVIRASRLNTEMFLADHDLIDGLIQNAPTPTVLDDGDVETVKEYYPYYFPFLVQYLVTVTLVHDTTDLANAAERHHEPEVVIEGGVPPEAVETVLVPESGAE